MTLTQDQIGSFLDQGYLVLDELLDDSDLSPIRSEYERVLDEAARELFEMGEISSTYEHLPFGDRYAKLITECPGVFFYLGISLPLDYESLEPQWVRMHSSEAFFDLISHPKILDVVESVIGPEIASNPVQQTRMKPPQRLLDGALAEYSNVGATTWHQDMGAVMDEAAETEMLTVWIAVTDATEEMGCLSVLPRSHREEELSLHCPGVKNAAENYIPQPILDRHGVDPIPLPVKAGSIVLLTRWTEHGALANVSDELRWSFDLRYQPIGQPTGRPAFPTTPLRSDLVETATAESYADAWENTRQKLLGGIYDEPIYEQGRWLANRDHPVCA